MFYIIIYVALVVGVGPIIVNVVKEYMYLIGSNYMNTMTEIFPLTCQVWIREKSSQMHILVHIISVSKSTKHRITRWHSNTHEYSYVCNT